MTDKKGKSATWHGTPTAPWRKKEATDVLAAVWAKKPEKRPVEVSLMQMAMTDTLVRERLSHARLDARPA